jgi:glycosyltransferase involved in cell wall biosynthesis
MNKFNRNIITQKPLISIITPSYNSGQFLPQAIESVLAQNYPQVEHLIIDGGSTDNTLTVLQQYQRHVTWLSEADNGQADALNKGFQRAQGEIIGWLNADDSYQPQAFWQATRYLQQHPEVSLVYGHFNFINEHDQIFYTHRVPAFSLEKLLYGNIIPNASMFFRREILAELDGVQLKLHYVMDWEFVWRIAQRYQVQRFPAIWGNFRIMPGTKSVEHTDRFWPEIIPTLETVSQIPTLQPHRDSALFWANLLAALEFARVDNLNATQQYWQQAMRYNEQSPYKVSNLIRADLTGGIF